MPRVVWGLTAEARVANITVSMGESRQVKTDKPGQTRRRHFLSYKRRWALWGTLLILIGLLITYNTLTQDHRVRAFLERELSEIAGGPVSVKEASFSIAGGLQVRDVTLSVDSEGRDDSQLVHAGQLNVSLNLSKLLSFDRDKLLDRVEAEHVRIRLCEDPADDTGTSSASFITLARRIHLTSHGGNPRPRS